MKKTPAQPTEQKSLGAEMAAKIRARANKLTEGERAVLMDDAMRIISGTKSNAVRAHRR